MKDDLVVRGVWGPREESADSYARRLRAFLLRLDGVVPGGFVSWHRPDVARPVELTDEALADLVRSGGDDERLDLGIGYLLMLSSRSPDWPKARLSMTVGVGEGTTNRIILTLAGRTVTEASRWARHVEGILLVLAEEWLPDWGDVGTYALWELQKEVGRPPKGAPRVGFVTYLSPERAEAVPSGLPVRYTRTREGGVLIGTLDSEGRLPRVDHVVRLGEQLQGSAALAAEPPGTGHG